LPSPPYVAPKGVDAWPKAKSEKHSNFRVLLPSRLQRAVLVSAGTTATASRFKPGSGSVFLPAANPQLPTERRRSTFEAPAVLNQG
jgi:hypothetical protein